MLSIIFFISAIIITGLSIFEKQVLAAILSVVLFFSIIFYSIYQGKFKPFNVINTKEIKENIGKYNGTDVRLEFPTIIDYKILEKDNKGLYLVELKVFNGETFIIYKNNVDQLKEDAIPVYAWISKDSDFWEKSLFSGKIEGVSLENLIATNCIISINKEAILLKKISNDRDFVISPYFYSYKFFNTFLSQGLSGLIALIIEIIALFFMLVLLIVGSNIIGISED